MRAKIKLQVLGEKRIRCIYKNLMKSQVKLLACGEEDFKSTLSL